MGPVATHRKLFTIRIKTFQNYRQYQLGRKTTKEWGVPADKIARIPIGVDTALFTLLHQNKEQKREKLGFSSHQL